MVSTHAPLAGSDCLSGLLSGARIVSTHAPLAGSDRRCRRRCPPRRVSTHAPLAGSDSAFAVPNWHTRQFQPTLPLRGATFVQVGYRCRCFCFNPRSPCGERHGGLGSASRRVVVSTHAPLAGSDQTILPSYPVEWQFQPTLPLRGATHLEVALVVEELVSTHAPLAGSDLRHEGIDPAGESFNPRSPCGERPEPKRTTLTKEGFNPRSPCGERYHGPQSDPGRLVSTHAPLAGSDTAHQSKSAEYSVSTHAPLAGSDARESRSKALDSTVSTHAPLAGSDGRHLRSAVYRGRVSTHAPLAGSDSWPRGSGRAARGFNPRSPCGERPRASLISGTAPSFNPRSPCGERRLRPPGYARPLRFNPRSPCGERPSLMGFPPYQGMFQPTLPLRGATADLVAVLSAQVAFQPTLPLRGATYQ